MYFSITGRPVYVILEDATASIPRLGTAIPRADTILKPMNDVLPHVDCGAVIFLTTIPASRRC